MMADDAAANRAHNAVMTGIVAGDATDNSAFQATFSFGGRRTDGQRGKRGQHHCGDHRESHARVPYVLNGEVEERSGFGLTPWQGPTKAFHLRTAPVCAAIVAIGLARAYTTLFLSSLIL
jgi:hypothetical protein